MKRIALTLFVLAASAAAQTQPGYIALALKDGNFNPSDWEFKEFTNGPPGAVTYTRFTTGGNTDAYLEPSVHIIPRVGANTFTFGTFRNKNAFYTPRTQGSIASFTYRQDAKYVSGSGPNGLLFSPAVFQSGKIYFIWATYGTGTNTAWHALDAMRSLAADDFSEISSTGTGYPVFSSHPNFKDGDRIDLGFVAYDYGNVDNTLQAGIDNWSVSIASSQPPSPAAPTMVIPQYYDAFTGDVLTVPASDGVLANAFYAAGAIASVDTPPSHGALNLKPNGSFSYRSNPGYQGYDQFIFRGSNSSSQLSSTATATISVVPGGRCEITVSHDPQFSVANWIVTVFDHDPIGGARVTLDTQTQITSDSGKAIFPISLISGINFATAEADVNGIPVTCLGQFFWERPMASSELGGDVGNCIGGFLITDDRGVKTASLASLRRFRDTILARTAKGRDWTHKYYQFSPEVIRMAGTDPALVFASLRMLGRARETIPQLLDGGRVQLTPADLGSIESLIGRVQRRAGPALRSALADLKRDLRDPTAMAQFGVALPTGQPAAWAMHGHVRLEANLGQAGPPFDFIARGPGYDIAVAGAQFVLHAPQGSLNVHLSGAVNRPGTGEEPEKAVTNYLYGSNRRQWITSVPRFNRVRYRNVYPGIDLLYYENDGKLEHDFVVAPGARPDRIALAFDGAKQVQLGSDGAAVIVNESGRVRLEKPVVYQATAQKSIHVDGSYRLDHGELRFEIGPYDHSLPLVIDPVLTYSTYLGGGGTDAVLAMAAGIDGSIYVTGTTRSTDFPLLNAYQATGGATANVFVSKLDPSGQLVYSTYIGGSGTDMGLGIAVDPAGNAYITGMTSSADFPVVSGYQTLLPGASGTTHAFVAKLDPAGANLVYSTFLGGSGQDVARGIVVNSDGSVYVAGATSSSDFPVAGALQSAFKDGALFHTDAFVARLDASGSRLLYSTYLGGAGDDAATSLAVDSSGNVYLAGFTSSTDFPVRGAVQSSLGGGYDAFVAKLNPTGSGLLFSTYLGGPGDDAAFGLALDAKGDAFVSGVAGTRFPKTNVLQMVAGPANSSGSHAFAAKIDMTNARTLYSTLIESPGADLSLALAVDAQGYAYLAGLTTATNLATVGAPQTQPGGQWDGFIARIAPDGSASDFRTYIGGSANDGVTSLALLPNGELAAAGATASPDLGIAGLAAQPQPGGSGDGWLARFKF